MAEITEDVLNSLLRSGVELVGAVPTPGGQLSVSLKAKDALEYIKDRDSFSARFYGVSRDEFLRCIASDFTARCGATTVKGTRCKNAAAGGYGVEPNVWVRLEGAYCETHGGC